eukprot:1068054-Prorocentrum_minimum.AAC.2
MPSGPPADPLRPPAALADRSAGARSRGRTQHERVRAAAEERGERTAAGGGLRGLLHQLLPPAAGGRRPGRPLLRNGAGAGRGSRGGSEGVQRGSIQRGSREFVHYRRQERDVHPSGVVGELRQRGWDASTNQGGERVDGRGLLTSWGLRNNHFIIHPSPPLSGHHAIAIATS